MMRRGYVPNAAAFTAAVVLVLSACVSEEEKARQTLLEYVDAVVKHRAPYNAYVHLDGDDKEHLAVDAYAAEFDTRERAVSPGSTVAVESLEIKGDRAQAVVTVTPPNGEPHARKYVMRHDGSKWRVWLGLETLDQHRATLDEARRLSADGAIEEAKEKVEAVATSPFLASRPEQIADEARMVRDSLQNRERTVEIDAGLTRATNAETVEEMRAAVADLRGKIAVDDETFRPRLVAVEAALVEREKTAALEGITIDEVRTRSYRDAWGTFREARFRIQNGGDRALSSVEVRVELLDDDEDEPVGQLDWELIEEGKTLAPGESLEIKREIEKAPRSWDDDEIAVRVTAVTIAEPTVAEEDSKVKADE